MSFRHLVVVVLALVLAGTVAAQCSVGPNTASVTLPDFLAVYYSQFRSLSSEDAAEFYGGVCVTAVGGEWTVTAEQVRVEGLSGDIRLEAPSPTGVDAGAQLVPYLIGSPEKNMRIFAAQSCSLDARRS